MKYIVKDSDSGYHEFADMEEVNKFLNDCCAFALTHEERKERFKIYRLL
jgi:hypothetical protein